MTWLEAQPLASARVAVMLDRLRAAGAPPGTEVRLTLYDDSAWPLFGDSGGQDWSRDDHEVITRAAARALRRAGYRPRFARLSGIEYLHWLAATDRTNSPATRALYAAKEPEA